MTKKPRMEALTVRLRENTWKALEADMKRDGLSSMNAAIQRRLDRTLIDERMQAIMEEIANKTAAKFAEIMAEHVQILAKDTAEEIGKLRHEADMDRRVVNLHEMVLNQIRKGETPNG